MVEFGHAGLELLEEEGVELCYVVWGVKCVFGYGVKNYCEYGMGVY